MADHESKQQTQATKTPAAKSNAGSVQSADMQPLANAAALQSPAAAITLQRNAGNQRVNRLIQAKLTVGAAHDPLEHEADRVADQVVSRSSLQRNTDEEDELQAKRVDVSRAPQDDDELMTKRSSLLDSFDAGSDFEQQLGSSGSGAPLDRKTRSEMEAGIGADFSNVRVHTGAQASQLNRSISARAFTRGSDVFFDRGQYNPGSTAGKRLIAHELTHVVQQGGAAQNTQRKAYSNATVQRWPWSKKKDTPATDNATTPKSDEGEEVKDTPTTPTNGESAETLTIDADYSNSTVKDQAPTRFKYTVLVWQQNKDYLNFQKIRAWSMMRNRMRDAFRAAGVGKLFVRKGKTSKEVKDKAARTVASQQDGFSNLDQQQQMQAINTAMSHSNDLGHTWSRLTAYAGDEVKDIYSFGFWPGNGIGRPDEATQGDVMHPDQVHDKDASLRVMHYDIPAKNYETALKWADGQVQNPPQYKMIGLNCTSWSRMLAGKAGVSLPSSANVFPAEPAQGFFQKIHSPNQLYNSLGNEDGVKDKVDAVPATKPNFFFSLNMQEEEGGGVLNIPNGKTLTLRDMNGSDIMDLDDGTRISIEDDAFPNVDDWQNVMVKVIGTSKFGVLYASELKAYYKEEGGSVGGGAQSRPQYELPEEKSVHTLVNPLTVETARGERTIAAGKKIMVTEANDEDAIQVESERDQQTGNSIRGTTDVASFHAAAKGD